MPRETIMGRTIPPLIHRSGHLLGALLLTLPLAVLAAPGASGAPPGAAPGAGPAVAAAAMPAFTEVDEVSDIPGRAALTDPDVVNPWGLALSPTSPLWVANNGTNTATLYAGGSGGTAVTKAALTVSVPGGAPTGQVFNDTAEFVVTGPAGGSGPARFLFASEGGEITGWNPAAAPTTAIVAASSHKAVYKGLALLHTGAGAYLLATDFHHARIDVYDGHFQRLHLPGAFTDEGLPHGYAPFNVAVLGDGIYVSYAKQGEGADEVDGPGLGFVDRYNAFGQLQQRIASRGALNAPWGMAIAPASFGAMAGHLLVGNFGDGRINCYSSTGGFDGQLSDSTGTPIAIDGLWALLPGTANTGGTDAVWFSAGLDDESHGLVGLIRPAS
jgi:uncharacterized protein (TIGR03118 family)